MFRIESHIILKLINLLKNKGRLHPSKDMTELETIAIFLWTYAHSETNRNVQNKFGKSKETVGSKFGKILDSLCLLTNKNGRTSILSIQ